MTSQVTQPLILSEITNINVLVALINSSFTDTEEKKQLKKYLKKADKLGNIEVSYEPSKHCLGRNYAKQGLSLQSFSKPIRHTLASNYYWDIDLVNAHPVILSQLCKKQKLSCDCLNDYIENREERLEELMNKVGVSRKVAKEFMIILLYLGSSEYWCQQFNHWDKLPDWVYEYEEELKCIADKFSLLYPDIEKIAKKYKDKEFVNIKASTLSIIIQIEENKILMSIYDQMRRLNRQVDVLVFDGLMVRKLENENEFSSELLDSVVNYVKINTNYDIKLDIKPMDNIYDLNDVCFSQNNDGVRNDVEASEKLFKLYPHWIFCRNELFVFNEDTGMWDTSNTAHLSIIKKYESELFLLSKVTKQGVTTYERTDKSYGNCLSLMEKLPPLIKTLCRNDNWLKEKQNSSLGKLLFNNGYFDLKEQKFYSKEEHKFNPNILFMGKIHHDWTAFNDEEMDYMNDIQRRLFYDPLGVEVGDYFILNLARGLAGDVMKRILFGLGGTNTGKSILTRALIYSCGDYIGSFNAENLAYNKSSCDEAQQMRWVMLLRFCRIIFSNEMKSTCDLNGNMIKKISSGGDTIIGRNHCKSEEEFSVHFLPVCLANDLPNIKPYDDAVKGRVRVISYTKSFVDEPSNEFELKKDEGIDEEIKTLKFKKAFVGLLIREYILFQQNGLPDEPQAVIQAKVDWGLGEGTSCIDEFLNDFEITNSVDDFTESKKIDSWLQEKKLGISMKKFGMEMKKHCTLKGFANVNNNLKKIKGKPERVWFGIKSLDLINDE
jgi:hypothetical protein